MNELPQTKASSTKYTHFLILLSIIAFCFYKIDTNSERKGDLLINLHNQQIAKSNEYEEFNPNPSIYWSFIYVM